MFERFRQSAEQKMVEKHEQRQMQFTQEQNAISAGTHPSDDQTFIQMQNQQSDLLRWQQDLEDELVGAIHDLKNEILIDGKWIPIIVTNVTSNGQTVQERLKPKINDRGIQMIRLSLMPLLSRNLINSNFSENRILLICKQTSNTIVTNLAANMDRYDIDSLTTASEIKRMVNNVIIAGPYRALNGVEKRLNSTMIKRIESYAERQQDDKKKGFFGIQ